MFFPTVGEGYPVTLVALPVWVVTAYLVGHVADRLRHLEQAQTNVHEQTFRRMAGLLRERDATLSAEQRELIVAVLGADADELLEELKMRGAST